MHAPDCTAGNCAHASNQCSEHGDAQGTVKPPATGGCLQGLHHWAKAAFAASGFAHCLPAAVTAWQLTTCWPSQIGAPAEEDLKSWGHHSSCSGDWSTVPDPLFARAAGSDVTFVFTCEVQGKPIDESAQRKPRPGGARLPCKRKVTCAAGEHSLICCQQQLIAGIRHSGIHVII